MYYYIIDPQKIDQRTFERVQNQLYSSIAQLRISGEISRVTTLRSVSQLVDTALLRGATSIVAVGHDSTVQDVINAVGDREVAVGYVPLQDSELSRILGIADVVSACNNLAHRRVEMLDLGRVHHNYFFTKVGIGVSLDNIAPKSMFDFSKFSQAANMKPVRIQMEIDGQFRAEFEVAVGAVFNSRGEMAQGSKLADPTDGLLDVLLLPGLSSFDAWKYRNELAAGALEQIPGCAVMHGHRLVISAPEGMPFYIGEKVAAKTPTVIEVLPRKIRMIIGKDRTF